MAASQVKCASTSATAGPQQHPYLDVLGQLTKQIAQPNRQAVTCQPETGRDVPSIGAPSTSELLVYADGPLEHRVCLLTLVANGLEHAGGQRIELALDGGLGP